MPLTLAEAKSRIETVILSTTEPVISSTEVDILLASAKRCDSEGNPPDNYFPWKPSTAYVVGDKVVPNPRNGFYYTVTVAGTSGSTQPTFPTVVGNTVVDGTVTWTNTATAPWKPTFNLPFAYALGFQMKAAKVATAVDVASADQRLKRSDMFTNFMKMSDEWRKRAGESIQLVSSTRPSGNINANSEDWCCNDWATEWFENLMSGSCFYGYDWFTGY